jgi:adenosylcobinamide kinase/adenosylcobinamide-phosphate guanylyltransferase
MKRLILGGVRSGKSRLAERLALESGLPVTYLATALPGDAEMAARIEAHRTRRLQHWRLVEEPYRLAEALRLHAEAGRCLLVECLTLWLTNLLLDADLQRFERERLALLDTLPNLPGELILVGNETNMGVIPMGALSRRFCDESGWLHQALAQSCEEVFLTVAGMPLQLKGDNR